MIPMAKEVSASAPGKFILLGEHAVVYGKPALALAINKRFRCTVRLSPELSLNGVPVSLDRQPHIRSILYAHGLKSAAILTDSQVPSSSGLGSSAALSSSFSLALRKLLDKPADKVAIAEEAFYSEYEAQGRASPMDTSACTFGKGVALNCPKDVGKHLWTASKNGNSWNVSEIPVPDMTFVIGYTGIKAATGPLVEKVRKYKEHSSFAADIIDEIENVTLEGMDCMKNKDIVGLGNMMTADHKLLSILGVSCNELNKLVNASLRYSYGAKLTGAGGGGSMIALTDRPDKVCEAILLHGGLPFIVKTGEEGVRFESC